MQEPQDLAAQHVGRSGGRAVESRAGLAIGMLFRTQVCPKDMPAALWQTQRSGTRRGQLRLRS